LHPEQSTGALKFPNAETLQDREVRRDRLSSAPATRDDRSRSRLRRGSASIEKRREKEQNALNSPGKYLLDPGIVESPSERLNLRMT